MKELTAKEMQSHGGKTTLEKYGVKHYTDMANKSNQVQDEKDPKRGERLAVYGMLARIKKSFKNGNMDEDTYQKKLAEYQARLNTLL